jgi:hypothetical protein
MSKLLAHQQATYNQTVYRLMNDGIKEFSSEHELFLFVEVVRYPFLNRTKVNTDILLYDGEANYGPIVKELVKKGILISNQTGYTVNL